MKKVKKIFNSSKQSIRVKDNDETCLKKVRSKYIIENILSLLDEKKRLSMIKYNKQIQNHLELKIEDFKKISGRYIIGERNGKGKEYLLENNILIYDGEYLKGKRHGKGKEFNTINGKIIFEGNFLNGKKMEKEKNIMIKIKLYFKEIM